MIKLIDAMVLWNDSRRSSSVKDDEALRIKVVIHSDFKGNEEYRYLGKHWGASSCTWESNSPEQRAAALLSLFNMIVAQGQLPADEVHKSFLDIIEYEQFHNPKNYNEEVYTNPFWRIYHKQWPEVEENS